MTFLPPHWRRFQFFDQTIVKEPNSKEPHQFFQKASITCTAAGRGNIILGDSQGFLNIVDRDFNIVSFQAYERRVDHLQQLKQRNVLITVGDDDEMVSPTIKIWNLDKDKSGVPLCVKSIKLQKYSNLPVTCIVALEDMSQLAVGLCNGAVMVIRGDIMRERSPKQKIVLGPSDRDVVNGLGFREQPKSVTLFVVTTSKILAINTTRGDTIECLDEQGCELNCSVISDESNMIVGRKEAVYFYEAEGRGPCFAFEGKKNLLSWFRTYLIVVGEDPSNPRNNNLNIYDLKNKFIAFSGNFDDVTHVVAEWGSVFVITKGTVYQLVEKDMQTKLETLFKKNLYSVAINLAVSQQIDHNSVIDIFRSYGDHLYGKGDYDGAINQYLKTIGSLEPSYVIRKFLDAQRIHNLTSYLQALHEKKLANADHTTLLINCYTKLKDVNKLNEFVKTDSELTFDVETAIKVCRQAGYYEHALYLAKKHNQHDLFLKILLEDSKDYNLALEYISSLSFEEAKKNIKRYGKVLVSNRPEATTKLLKSLCTNYVPSESKNFPTDRRRVAASNLKADPEKFIRLFVDQPDYLVDFLEYIIHEGQSNAMIFNTLLELYLRNDTIQPQNQKERLDKALILLNNPNAKFDADHAIVLCQTHSFREGILLLYEKLGLFNEIVQYHMEHGEYQNIIRACKKYGPKDPNLWIQALSYFSGKEEEDFQSAIVEVLTNIDRDNLLPPLLVLQILSQNSRVTLAVIKDYITKRLQQESQLIAEDQRQIKAYSDETEKMRNEIEELKTGAKIFQSSKCTACTSPLDLPAIHFLCMHSFHQRCLGENERECPVCGPQNKKIVEIKKALDDNAGQHEQFFKQLEGSPDGFSTVAEYFGRGLFDGNIFKEKPKKSRETGRGKK